MSEPQRPNELPGTRSIEFEIEIDAPLGDVWRALTEGDLLASWFPLESRAEPREGGKVWFSWGPEVQWETTVECFELQRHLRWADPLPADAPPGAVPLAVDFYIETRAGSTVLRLVHSGFSAAADWDGQYDATRGGWQWFLFHLKHWLEAHGPGLRRHMAWTRRRFEQTASEVWERALGPDGLALDGPQSGLKIGDRLRFALDAAELVDGIVTTLNMPYQLGVSLPGLDEALLFLEVESAKGPIGIWLSLFDASEEMRKRGQAAVERFADRILRAP